MFEMEISHLKISDKNRSRKLMSPRRSDGHIVIIYVFLRTIRIYIYIYTFVYVYLFEYGSSRQEDQHISSVQFSRTTVIILFPPALV